MSDCFISDFKSYKMDFSVSFMLRLIFSFSLMLLSQQRLVRDFYKILNEVSTQEIPDGLKLPESFSQLVSDMKNNHYDARTFSLVLRAMVHSLICN